MGTSREITGIRKSQRQLNKKEKDYKVMNEGAGQVHTLGSTEFSAHVPSRRHGKEDLFLCITRTDIHTDYTEY